MTRYIALCKIIELGSFTKAAQALGYTQAAISQMISSLEKEFSFKLLVRTRTGITLTSEGATLYPLIQKSVYVNQDLADKVNEIKGLSSGEVRIGTFTSIAQHWLPKLIKEFNEIYPNIKFILHQGDNITIPEWIKSNKVDFGFVSYKETPDLKLDEVDEDLYYAVFPKKHRLACLEKIPLKELENEQLLMIEEGTPNNAIQHFNELGLYPEVKFRIQDDFTILSMVEENFGVSILPSLVLKRTSYEYSAVPTEPSIHRKIYLAYQNIGLMSMAAQKFMEFVKKRLPNVIEDIKKTL